MRPGHPIRPLRKAGSADKARLDLVPGDELGLTGFEFVKAPIEFRPLGESKLDITGALAQRVPQVADKAQTLFRVERIDVYRRNAYVPMIPLTIKR